MAGRSTTHSERWWSENAPAHVVRCTAQYKSTGERCRREAAPGTNVCNQHGARIPAVQAAAARRIQMTVDDAVKRLHGMLDDPDVEARDKIKILQDLLDRGGLGATSKVLVGVASADPVERLFQDLLTTPGALNDPSAAPPEPDPLILELNRQALDYADDDIVDAELVEDDPRHPATIAAVEEKLRASAKMPKHIREGLRRLL